MDEILDNAMQEPKIVGVILIDELALCIASRGELQESDAAPIVQFLDRAGAQTDSTGEILYGGQGRTLHFRRTSSYTFAILKSTVPSPPPSTHEPSSLDTIKHLLPPGNSP